MSTGKKERLGEFAVLRLAVSRVERDDQEEQPKRDMQWKCGHSGWDYGPPPFERKTENDRQGKKSIRTFFCKTHRLRQEGNWRLAMQEIFGQLERTLQGDPGWKKSEEVGRGPSMSSGEGSTKAGRAHPGAPQ